MGRRTGRAIWLAVVASAVLVVLSPAQMVSQDKKDADDAYRSRRNDDAITLYRRVVKSDPNDGEAWFRLGLSLHNDSQFRDAIPAYEKSRELKYARLLSQYNIGCAYARLGEKERAFTELEKSVAMGFSDVRQMRDDPDLVGIRSDRRFSDILNDATRPAEKFAAARRLNGLFGLWQGTNKDGGRATMTGNTGAKGFGRQVELLDDKGKALYLFLAYSASDGAWLVSGADRSGATYGGTAAVSDGQMVCEGHREGVAVRAVLTFGSFSSGTLTLEERRGSGWAGTAVWNLEKTGLPDGQPGGR